MKSPLVITSIPIMMSAPLNSPLVTRRPTNWTALGKRMLTRYTSDSCFPCTPVTWVRLIGDRPHESITVWVITQFVAPVSHNASNSLSSGGSSPESGSNASEISHWLTSSLRIWCPSDVKAREVMRRLRGSGMSEKCQCFLKRPVEPKTFRDRGFS